VSNRVDISDYLLGELSDEQREEAERLLREDPAFRAEVERLRPAVTQLESLPPEAWERIEPPPLALPAADEVSAARSEPRSGAGDEPPPPWWRKRIALPTMRIALASLVLLAVGVGGGLLIADGDSERERGEVLALEPVEPRGGGASGSAELIGSAGGEAVVEVRGVEANGPDEFYELWLLSSPDDLISLGAFKVDDSGSATVRVPLPVDPGRFDFVDLSLERDDGDASHSGASVLRART
jgi:anti-sigma-K factor RskA